MKKMLTGILACVLMLVSVFGVWAEEAEENTAAETIVEENAENTAEETAGEETPEEPEEPEIPELVYDYDVLKVAVTTPLTGNFFTSLWGNSSSDIDVRSMIHGYNLTEWDVEKNMFVTDESVVSGITAQREENGDVTFIIVLYNDLFYSNGTRITAWDYAFSMLLTMAPEMKELGAQVKTPAYISGYNDYISGASQSLAGVRVLSDDLIHIRIDGSYLPFFYELGLLDCVPYPISVIAPGVVVKDDGNGIYLANEDPANETPVFTADLLKETVLNETTGYRTHPSVCSGPYLLTSYEDGVAKFEINPQYKGNSHGKLPLIPRVEMSSIASEDIAQHYGDASLTLINKVSNMDAIRASMEIASNIPILTYANYERSGMSFLNFHTEQGPLGELAVRQAIAYLADRDGITRGALGGYGMRARGYFGIGQWMYLVLNKSVGYPITTGPNGEPAEDEEEQLAQWEALSLDEIELYERDAEKGNELLADAGWNLNENGEAFVPGTDKVRYKNIEGELVPLKLTLAYAEKSAAGAELEGLLVESLAEGGIELTVEAVPAEDLLNEYYRLAEPKHDMVFLATNFDMLYDPSTNFIETEDGHHMWLNSGLVDDELWELAVSMRQTEPADLLGYCGKWLAFQKRFMEQLPVLPVYTNVYFDFYPLVLHEYYIADAMSWPQAIIGAYLADYIPEEEPAEGEELDDNTMMMP